jgi:hypothetical protein
MEGPTHLAVLDVVSRIRPSMPGAQKRFQVVSSPERESWFEYTQAEVERKMLFENGHQDVNRRETLPRKPI